MENHKKPHSSEGEPPAAAEEKQTAGEERFDSVPGYVKRDYPVFGYE